MCIRVSLKASRLMLWCKWPFPFAFDKIYWSMDVRATFQFVCVGIHFPAYSTCPPYLAGDCQLVNGCGRRQLRSAAVPRAWSLQRPQVSGAGASSLPPRLSGTDYLYLCINWTSLSNILRDSWRRISFVLTARGDWKCRSDKWRTLKEHLQSLLLRLVS